MSLLKTLFDKRSVAYNRLMELGKSQETQEERNNFDACYKELEDLDAKIEVEVKLTEARGKEGELRARLAEFDSSIIDPSIALGGSGGAGVKPGEQRNAAGKFEFRGLQFETKEEIRAYAEMECFRSFIKYGERGVNSLPQELRALSASDFSAGGATTAPKAFMAKLLQNVDALTEMGRLVTTEYVEKAESLGVVSLDSDFTDDAKLGENETAAEDNLGFGEREMKPNRFGKRVKVSRELLVRTTRDIEDLIIKRLDAALARTKEKKLILGSGAGEPLGLMVANNDGIPTSRDVAAAGASAVDFDSALDMIYKVPTQYHAQSAFYFNPAVVKAYRKLKATTNDYLWQDAVRAGEVPTLHGFPVRKSEYMPGTITTGLYTGLFGDLGSAYTWVNAWENFFRRADELYLEANQVGFFSHVYFDGAPVLAEAVARIKQP